MQINSQLRTDLSNAPEGRKLIDPYIQEIASIPNGAWNVLNNDYSKHREKYEPTHLTNILHVHMVDLAKELSFRERGIEYWNPYPKQHLLKIEKRACIRFKKMDEDLNTSNIPTQIQKEFDNGQLDLLEADRLEHLINVGYIPFEDWTGYRKIVIVEKYGLKQPSWTIEFDRNFNIIEDAYGTTELPLTFERNSSPIENDEPEVEVRVKKKK